MNITPQPGPDTQPAAYMAQPDQSKLNQNTSEPSAGVCSAGPSRMYAVTGSPQADTRLGAGGTPPAATAGASPHFGEAWNWTVSERLDFVVLWLAVELSTAEIAAHFGLTTRHLTRLRTDFGLAARPGLRRLDRAARQRLVAFEVWSAFMTPMGQALLKVAQARRQVQDEARAALAREAAQRSWRYLQEPQGTEISHTRRLRQEFRRGY